MYLESFQLRLEVFIDDDGAIVGSGEEHPDIDQESQSVEAWDVVKNAPKEVVS